LDRGFLERVSIEAVQPEPDSVGLETDWVAYNFEIAETTSSTIRFTITRDDAGVLTPRVKVNTSAPHELWQFAFP
jgi:hypothetical protein